RGESRRRRLERVAAPLRARFRGLGAARRAVRAGARLSRRDPHSHRLTPSQRTAPNDQRTMTTRHRTLIAEDEPLASEALSAWVNEMPMLELVGCRADGVSALAALRELAPALVLMDI